MDTAEPDLPCWVSLCIYRLHPTQLHSPDWLEFSGLWGLLELLTEWEIVKCQASGRMDVHPSFLGLSNHKTQPLSLALPFFEEY